jgi:hypothetical protein
VRKLIATLAALLSAVAICTATAGARDASARAGARAATHSCRVPGVHEPLDRVWRPDMRAAIDYAHTRQGDITFAVRTLGAFYGYRQYHQEWSASIVKAMLMVAYLDMPSVANRALTSYDTSLLDPMITESDNDAADAVDTIVGGGGLNALAARVGMHGFSASEPIWGDSEINAANQTWFFLHIDDYVVPRHRGYALHLLASITPSQRWGIGKVAPNGWKLYFKGGWGAGTGLVDSQAGLLPRLGRGPDDVRRIAPVRERDAPADLRPAAARAPDGVPHPLSLTLYNPGCGSELVSTTWKSRPVS